MLILSLIQWPRYWDIWHVSSWRYRWSSKIKVMSQRSRVKNVHFRLGL